MQCASIHACMTDIWGGGHFKHTVDVTLKRTSRGLLFYACVDTLVGSTCYRYIHT